MYSPLHRSLALLISTLFLYSFGSATGFSEADTLAGTITNNNGIKLSYATAPSFSQFSRKTQPTQRYTYPLNTPLSYSISQNGMFKQSGISMTPSIWSTHAKTQPEPQQNGGLLKTFMKGRGSIKIEASNMFDTFGRKSTQNYSGLKVDLFGNQELRQVKINVSFQLERR